MDEDILARFDSVELNDVSWMKVRRIESGIKELARDILQFAEGSRERSLALTALEEVKMWAFRSVAVDQEKSD